MQIICDGLDLADAVLKVSKAISAKTTNPILEGIKLKAEENELTLFCTDLELSIEKKIRANVLEEGEAIVPGKFFSEFVKKISSEKIELVSDEKQKLIIKYMDSEGSISCYGTDEYPDVKTVDTEQFFGISKLGLKNLINKTIFSVAIDDSRPILKGCLLEISETDICAVTTDSYRISLAKQKTTFSNTKCSVIVPDKSMREISKLLDDSEDIINVYISNNFLMIDLGDTKIITRLLEGEFLNYRQIVASSNGDTFITVAKSQLENSLERASLLSKIGQNNLVNFAIKENNMCITSNSEIGNIKENITISLEGKDIVIAFNARYFMEAFRACDNEFVKIAFSSPTNPCIITPVDNSAEVDEFLYLILPVRMMN